MKVTTDEIIKDNRSSPMASLVFSSMVRTFKGEGFAQFLKDIDWEGQDEVEVKLTIEGIELDIREYCERWDKNIDKEIKKAAVELVEEKFAKISNVADDIHKDMRRKAKEELGLDLDDYDY